MTFACKEGFLSEEQRRNDEAQSGVTNHSIMFTGHTDLDVGLARDYPRFLKKIEFE